MLDQSIPEPDVMDWSEDWSYSESSLCAEDVSPEQSQVLALEVLVAEENRTLAQARPAVGVSKTESQWFLPSFQCVFQS